MNRPGGQSESEKRPGSSVPAAPGDASAWERADAATATEAYAERFAGEVGAWFLTVQAEYTIDVLRSVPNESGPLRLLEVGGGHAQLVPHLVEAGHDVTTVGSDERCAARLTPWIRSGQCTFDVANPAALPYPDQAFDAVLAFRLLPHVSDWRGFIREISRVARRSVIIDYPSRRSMNAISGLLFGAKKRIEKNTRPFRLFSPASIRAEFHAAGFTLAESRPQFFWPMVLHRAVRSARVARNLELVPRLLGLTEAFGSPIIARADRREPTPQRGVSR